jgi:hypothetical protein
MKWVEYVLHIHPCILNLFGKHEALLNELWNVWGIGLNRPLMSVFILGLGINE